MLVLTIRAFIVPNICIQTSILLPAMALVMQVSVSNSDILTVIHSFYVDRFSVGHVMDLYAVLPIEC